MRTRPLTVGTRERGNGTGMQRERGRTAVNLNPLLAFFVEVTTGGSPVKFSTPSRKGEISFTKRNCATIADTRVMEQITAEVARVSSARRNTTQVCATNLW